MNLKNTQYGYGLVSRVFHLLMALMIIGQLAVGFWMVGLLPKEKADIYASHKLGGLLILSLVVLRLVWRSMNQLPDLPNTPVWQIWAARSLQRFFYVMMFAMPITGWIMSSAAGYHPSVADVSLVFPFIDRLSCTMMECSMKGLGLNAKLAHMYFGVLFAVLISIHTLIALYHAYLKDGIAARIFVDRT
jgi:cytochrome b561